LSLKSFVFTIFDGLGICSFICLSTLAKRQRSDLFGRRAATCYYQFNYSKVEAISLSAFPKDTTSELAGLSSYYPFIMLNDKQESCEYQILVFLTF